MEFTSSFQEGSPVVLIYGQGMLSVCHPYTALKWVLKYVTQALEMGMVVTTVSPSCCQSRQ